MSPETCKVCGGDEYIDHGAEHMGIVEFPESICEGCWRDREAARVLVGPDLPIAFCKSCHTRLAFEQVRWRGRLGVISTGWRCHCTGCMDGEYGARAGEGTSPWEALDDCAAMHWDCLPEELMKEGT